MRLATGEAFTRSPAPFADAPIHDDVHVADDPERFARLRHQVRPVHRDDAE